MFGMGTGGTLSLRSPKVVLPEVLLRGVSELNIDGATKLERLNHSIFTVKFYGQAERAISNGQLSTLLHLHLQPINVVVYHESHGQY